MAVNQVVLDFVLRSLSSRTLWFVKEQTYLLSRNLAGFLFLLPATEFTVFGITKPSYIMGSLVQGAERRIRCMRGKDHI